MEARPGLAVALAGLRPLLVHAVGPRMTLGRRARRHLVVELARIEPRVLAVDPGDQDAALAEEELAARLRQILAGGEEARARRAQVAVAPHHAELGSLAAGGEVVLDARRRRGGLGEGSRGLGGQTVGIAQIVGPERGVHRVAGDVAQRAGAEVPPASPVEGMVGGMVRPERSGPEEEVPVQPLRGVVRLARALDRLRPDRAVGPVVDLAHLADHAGLEPLPDLARGSGSVPWFPIWVATPASRAALASTRASWIVRVSGFSQ